jgi:hypothetical protein
VMGYMIPWDEKIPLWIRHFGPEIWRMVCLNEVQARYTRNESNDSFT